jgi:Protein kinase domain
LPIIYFKTQQRAFEINFSKKSNHMGDILSIYQPRSRDYRPTSSGKDLVEDAYNFLFPSDSNQCASLTTPLDMSNFIYYTETGNLESFTLEQHPAIKWVSSRVLGEGAFGVVKEFRPRINDQEVTQARSIAVKTIKTDRNDKEAVTSKDACLGTCEGILRTRLLYKTKLYTYYAMELMNGAIDNPDIIPSTLDEIFSIVETVRSQVSCLAHKKRYYTDIKAQNVLFKRTLNATSYHLGDLGSTNGSYTFLCPEDLKSETIESCIMWTLGALFFQLVWIKAGQNAENTYFVSRKYVVNEEIKKEKLKSMLEEELHSGNENSAIRALREKFNVSLTTNTPVSTFKDLNKYYFDTLRIYQIVVFVRNAQKIVGSNDDEKILKYASILGKMMAVDPEHRYDLHTSFFDKSVQNQTLTTGERNIVRRIALGT